MEYRKNNFTKLEKACLTDIVKEYAHAIENKQTDWASLRAKNCAWEIVTQAFNATPYALKQTTSKQLRRLWTNMKQRQRTMLAQERQYRLATGGGPPSNDGSLDPDIAAVAPALMGIEEAVDSDQKPEIIIPDSQPSMDMSYDPLLLPPAPAHSHSPPPHFQLGSQRQCHIILTKEFEDRKRRFDEVHKIEMLVWKEKLREAKAKADLAELLLRQQKRSAGETALETVNK